jgi:hypothetical protein
MDSVRCVTGRASTGSSAEAQQISARVRKPIQALQGSYCGWWHVVGVGSPWDCCRFGRRRQQPGDGVPDFDRAFAPSGTTSRGRRTHGRQGMIAKC